MSSPRSLSIGFDASAVVSLRRRLFHITRQVRSARSSVKWMLTLAMVAFIGYIDFVTGDEIAFSIFYLVPIWFCTWFLGTRAGVGVAIIASIIWFYVDAGLRPAYSQPIIAVWNGLMRLLFFFVAVLAAMMIKRMKHQLLREVSRRDLDLRGEVRRRRQLEKELVELSAREQVRIAQDLHDGLGQYLSALTFHARMLADDLRLQRSPQLPQAERIVSLIRATNQITRDIDRALRVPRAGDGDFFVIIRALGNSLEQLTGVRCEIDTSDTLLVLDEFCTVMLYRIVQEALNNAVKHANPRVIRVEMAVHDQTLNISIADDGRGFSADGEREQQAGNGIRAMNLRAQLIQARLQFGRAEGGGCRVQCAVPIGQERLRTAA